MCSHVQMDENSANPYREAYHFGQMPTYDPNHE